MFRRPDMTFEDDRWGRDSSAPSGEVEKLRREVDEAKRRADILQDKLNLQKQSTIQGNGLNFK
jgi:predicted RNase H-like nuclease (RuvC/YqgF family)